MSAEDVVKAFAAARPHAATLAEVVSFAVLVDRPLLRQARVRLVPEADAGAEADLWLSPLVKSRSHDGITFTPEIARVLRLRLASEAARANQAWRLTEELHAHLPPTLKLEETINHLSIDESAEAAQKIDELLSSVLAAMAAGGRDGLASWAARALENFPTSVRRRDTAQMLAAGASLRLGTDPRQALGTGLPEWLRFIAPAHLPMGTVGVQLAPRLLRVDASPSPAGQLVRLPATQPFLLDVSWIDEAGKPDGRQLALRPGDVQHLEVGADDVQLRTVTGDVYELRLGGTAPVEVRPAIIDFSEVLERRDFYIDETDRVQNITSGHDKFQITLVTGPPGSGKTSTLAEIVNRLSGEGTFCAYHFFDAGTPKLEYWEPAQRSLIAQFMTRYDIPAWALNLGLPEFLRTFAKVVGTGPAYVVLDNVDVVKPDGSGSDMLMSLVDIPPQLVFIASATSEPVSRHLGGTRVVELQPANEREVEAYLANVTLGRPSGGQLFGALELFVRQSAFTDGPLPELPPRESPERRLVDALAVARAPFPYEDANRLRASVGIPEDANSTWYIERPHQGEPCLVILNEYVRAQILAQMALGDDTRAHHQLARAISGDELPPEQRTWYGTRHGAWHWLHGGWQMTERLTSARDLQRAIELFGARVAVDMIEEVAGVAVAT